MLSRFPPPSLGRGPALRMLQCRLRLRSPAHAFDARRTGHPRVLHIRRYEGSANRRASLRGISTKPGYDRDEYPPAMTDEGGEGASVRYVRSAANRSAGSVMRNQLAPYCDEQRFTFERWRNR
jgi:hypothetical protein